MNAATIAKRIEAIAAELREEATKPLTIKADSTVAATCEQLVEKYNRCDVRMSIEWDGYSKVWETKWAVWDGDKMHIAPTLAEAIRVMEIANAPSVTIPAGQLAQALPQLNEVF